MPAHVYFEAAAYQAKVHAEDISELLRISERLIKQAQDQMMHGRRSSG